MDVSGCPQPELCHLTISEDSGNVGLAFGLTIAAGLSTTIGAALPLLPCVDETKTHFLSIGLGVSSGVMLYISFAEILPEARDYMCCVTGPASPAGYNGLGVLCFFLGAFLTWGLHRASHAVAAAGKKAVGRVRAGVRGLLGLGTRTGSSSGSGSGSGRAGQERRGSTEAIARGNSSTALTSTTAHGGSGSSEGPPAAGEGEGGAGSSSAIEVELPTHTLAHSRGGRVHAMQGKGSGTGEDAADTPMPDSEDSVVLGELELQQALPREGFHHHSTAQRRMTGGSSSGSSAALVTTHADAQDAPLVQHASSSTTWDAAGQTYAGGVGVGVGVGTPLPTSSPTDGEAAQLVRPPTLADYGHGHGVGVGGSEEEAKARLKAMGVLTGAAIFVHNIPEGMVTFIGALSSPRLGYALALAVALHNIPEGIAAAAPIYYATGNRKAAFWWGFVSGVSEPLGALVGYLALRSIFSPASFGAIFGLVSGMMVYIVVREALPTAHRYDPKDSWTTPSVFAGMAVMAASLLLFDL